MESKAVPHTPKSYREAMTEEVREALDRAFKSGKPVLPVVMDFVTRAFREGHEQGHTAGRRAENQRQENLRTRR